MYVCASVQGLVPTEARKRKSGPLELELQMFMSHHVGRCWGSSLGPPAPLIVTIIMVVRAQKFLVTTMNQTLTMCQARESKKEKHYTSYQIIKQEWTVINDVKGVLCELKRVWGCGREVSFIFQLEGQETLL